MKEVNDFIKKFGVEAFDRQIARIDNAFFVIPDKFKMYVRFRPVYVGEKVGFMRGDHFVPSVDLLQWVAKHSNQTKTLMPDHEWKFICGNNIRLSELEGNFNVGEWILVLNLHQECIGIAEVAEKYLKRVFDIGDLLRRERKSRRS